MIVVVVECFAAGELGREYGLVVHQPGKQRDGACIYPTALAARSPAFPPPPPIARPKNHTHCA